MLLPCAAPPREREYTSLRSRGQMPVPRKLGTSSVRNKGYWTGSVTHCGLFCKHCEVRGATAVRRAKTCPGHNGPGQRLNPGVRPALTSVRPRPDPDLLHARHGPQVVYVPVHAFLFSEVPSQPRRQDALRRADIHVPAGREAAMPKFPGRNPARPAEAQDKTIDAGIFGKRSSVQLGFLPTKTPKHHQALRGNGWPRIPREEVVPSRFGPRGLGPSQPSSWCLGVWVASLPRLGSA